MHIKLFGHELIWRRIPELNNFTTQISNHVRFDRDDQYVRVKPIEGYELSELKDIQIDAWTKIDGSKVLLVSKRV